MPYVVIEAAAAGIPMVAANIGGIPEIFGEHGDALFAPQQRRRDGRCHRSRAEGSGRGDGAGQVLRERIFMHFSQKAMVEGVFAGYRDAFANR